MNIRPATPDDRPAIIRLAVRALHWQGDERDVSFFGWKHDGNPFGSSPAWVAAEGDDLLGFRTFLRWELVHEGARLRVVRAVDTATDPDHQGRGVFRALTQHAVTELSSDGYDAVFNTPNSQSRPGYLRMGWEELGRPTLAVRPRGLLPAVRMVKSRQPAEKWSEDCRLGEPAAEALGNSVVASVLAALPPAAGWSTPRTPGYLRWRYGFAPLCYRAVEVRNGLAVFRVRRRGPNREVALCEWLAPGPDRRAVRHMLSAGDYIVASGLSASHGFVPVRRLGPIVTWRVLAQQDVPSLADLAFGLGDLELF